MVGLSPKSYRLNMLAGYAFRLPYQEGSGERVDKLGDVELKQSIARPSH